MKQLSNPFEDPAGVPRVPIGCRTPSLGRENRIQDVAAWDLWARPEEHRVEDDHGRDHGLCPPGSTRTRLGRSPRRRSRRCRGPRQPRSLRVLNPSVGTGALLLVVEEELRQVLLLVSSVARLLMLAQDLRPPSPRRLRQRLRDVHPGPGLNHGRSDRPQFRPRLRARERAVGSDPRAPADGFSDAFSWSQVAKLLRASSWSAWNSHPRLGSVVAGFDGPCTCCSRFSA